MNILKKNRGFILFVILMFSVRWSIADHYRVPTRSMISAIEIGDHVFVNKMAYDIKLPFTNIVLHKRTDPKKGEIVIFENPKNPSINFVKRLIGEPGDKISIRDGFVFVNDELTLKSNRELKKQFQKLVSHYSKFKYYEQLRSKLY